MSPVISRYEAKDEGGGYTFRCPGCNRHHGIQVGDGPGPRWGFNGDVERPTFTPSLLVRSGHHSPLSQGKPCWCSFKERTGQDAAFECGVCHSFITNGLIQFLGDCTHALAGQSVPLPPIEEDQDD